MAEPKQSFQDDLEGPKGDKVETSKTKRTKQKKDLSFTQASHYFKKEKFSMRSKKTSKRRAKII